MAFPQSKLDTQLHFKFDGVNWTDATPYLYAREDGGVAITRGRQDWGQRVDPGTCTFQLDNRDGRFSPRNPTGPYYGQIGRNTPVRLSVNQGLTYLDLPGGTTRATTPDNATVSITGDIDVRVDYYLEDWDSTALPTELCGKYSSGGQRSWLFTLWQGKPLVYWSTDGTAEFTATSTTTVVPNASGRLALRFTLDVDNGAAGRTFTFYTAPTVAGPWTQLGDPVVQAGTTSIFDNAQPVDVGAVGTFGFPDPVGKVYGFELRNGINGTVVANPDFTIQTAGASTFNDAAGRTWTFFGGASLSNRKIRFTGEVPEWPLNQDSTGNDVYVEIQAAGRLRRMKNNTAPLQSTLRRRVPTFSPYAYWPMEEGAQATSATGLPVGVSPLTISTVNWAANDTLVGSDALPTLSVTSAAPCTLRGDVPQTGAAPTEWSAIFVYRLDTPNATQRTFMTVRSTGTVQQWFLQWGSGGTTIIGKDGEGVNVFSQAIASGLENFNTWIRVELQATQNGGNVDWHIGWVPVGGAGTAFGASFAGTVGRPTGFTSPPAGFSTDLDGLSLGHFSAWSNKTTASTAYNNSDIAWAGETCKARYQRIISEEGLDMTLRSDGNAQEFIGGQRTVQLYEILQDTADVDNGILMEHRERVGLLWRDHNSLYNQTPRASLAYPQIQAPLVPADDDQATTNIFTANRTAASSYTASLDSGRMSKLEFPNGVGPYPDEITLPLYLDADTANQANWRLHLGTVDEARYPTVNVWLQRSTAALEQILAVDTGDRIQITSPNVRYQYDTIDLLVQGYTEYISQYRWEFSFNCTPASPWDIAFASTIGSATATDMWDWADTTSSKLAEALTTTETDVDILTARAVSTNTADETALWTSNPADSPYLLSVAGETIRVDAPGGFVNTNPFFDVNATGWSGLNSAVARSTAFFPSHPNAVASLKVTPTGGFTTAEALSSTTANDTVTRNAQYVSSSWVYSPTGWASGVTPAIDWYTNAGAYISTSTTTSTALVAGQWTFVQATFSAPATAGKGAAKVVQTGTPTAADIYYLWGPRYHRVKASAIYDNFNRTDTDTWTLAESGQTWVNNGTAADYDVLTGFGRHTHPAASVGHHSTTAAPNADGDLYVDIAVAALSTGASQFAGALHRFTDVDNLYEARVEFTTANAINLTLRKRVATVETQLATFADGTATAGGYVRVRFQIVGSNLKAKIWNPALVSEPYFWALEVTDTAITAAGSVGVKSVRNAGNTNANAIFQFDNLDLVNAQTFTCTRSFNNVVKAQSANTDIALRFPGTAAF